HFALPTNERIRLKALEAEGAFVCFWRSDENARPANGGKAFRAKVGLVQKIDGPLKICSKWALHGTLNPSAWKGERIWLVALKGEVQEEGDKFGALEREIIAEITPAKKKGGGQ